MRWLTLLGRIGSALLALGLAFVLVFVIPPAPIGTRGGPGWQVVKPDSYSSTSWGTFTPRTGFQLSLTSNSSIQFYILAKRPELPERKPSYLADYLQEHPDEVFYSATIDEELTVSFLPPRVTEVWLYYSNPSEMSVYVTRTFRYETVLVSKEQVQMPTIVLIISGGVLILPRILRREKS
ncbi:MAG: hypothetical protein GTO54_12725 [Nitrososphaeria archaeon]|nr:hypothetical protein [Nitrososphaeria archaeon]